MKCVGCNKVLPKGEFVVLSGGALRKTRTGSVIDKNLVGFLSVTNHFDSQRNYRSMYLSMDAKNGQFEFYACTHKCLLKFLTKYVQHLSKIDKAVKYKKIVMAPVKKINKVGEEPVRAVLKLMGFPEAMVTDMSRLCDFYAFDGQKEQDRSLERLSKKLGFKVDIDDHIFQIAEKYKLR